MLKVCAVDRKSSEVDRSRGLFIESLGNYWARSKNCFMLPVFISMVRNCNGFKVKITKYQLKKQIALVLSKNRQSNFSGFDLNMPSGPKSYRDFPARVLQKIRFSFTTSILVKITQIIWRSIWIQMDFDINSAYFT